MNIRIAIRYFLVLSLVACSSRWGVAEEEQPFGVTDDAVHRNDLELGGCRVWVDGKSVLIQPAPMVSSKSPVLIPRLPCRMKAVHWTDTEIKVELRLWPETEEWQIRLNAVAPENGIIELELLDTVPKSLSLPTIKAQENGTLTIPPHFAQTHGEKLRFEPQPHKNTVGYWTIPTDWVSWRINVPLAGKYELEILQGCGTGQGGSEVDVVVRAIDDLEAEVDRVSFVVKDTGHFQNFESRKIGTMTFPEAGAHQIEIRPQKLANKAVMDVRQITLRPVIE